MELLDLGLLSGPVLVFGGPYSNLSALRALVGRALELGIAPERMICTGDLVAYCAQDSETVSEIRRLGCTVVAGNCEKQLANNAMTCGCGFEKDPSAMFCPGRGMCMQIARSGWWAGVGSRACRI